MATLRARLRRPGRRLATLASAPLLAALTIGAAFEDPTCPHHEPAAGVHDRHETHAHHAHHAHHEHHEHHEQDEHLPAHAHDDEEQPCACAGFCLVAGLVAAPAAPPAPLSQPMPAAVAAGDPVPAAPPARRPADFLPLPNAPPASRLS
jgi:hypothetical protein